MFRYIHSAYTGFIEKCNKIKENREKRKMPTIFPYPNADIFEQIFNINDKFCTQVRLAASFEEYVDVATRIWGNYKFTSTLDPQSDLIKSLTDTSDYQFFMRVMAPHFKEFSFLGKDERNLGQFISHLEDLHLKEFSSIKNCTLFTSSNDIEDEDILKLTTMMPNVKTIHITSRSFAGAHLENFNLLEELYLELVECHLPTKTEAIQNIFTTVHNLRVLELRVNQLEPTDITLQNLEILIIDQSILSHIMEQVVVLPRLQKLSVYANENYVEPLFKEILLRTASKITGVFVNNFILKLEENWGIELGPPPLPKLRKIVFNHWQYSNYFLSGLEYDRGQIETIDCSFWNCMEKPDLMKLVTDHHNLQELRIDFCGIRMNYYLEDSPYLDIKPEREEKYFSYGYQFEFDTT